MEQKNKLKLNSGGLLVFILTVGVFGIINTEMGVVGILPLLDGKCFCIGGGCVSPCDAFIIFGD